MEPRQPMVQLARGSAPRFDQDPDKLCDHALLALAHPARRTILQRLTRKEGTVDDLAREFPDLATNLAYHIRALRDGGLVTSHRLPDRRSVYRARLPIIREITAMMSAFDV